MNPFRAWPSFVYSAAKSDPRRVRVPECGLYGPSEQNAQSELLHHAQSGECARNVSFVVVLWYFGSASLNGAGIVSIGVLYAFVDLLGRMFQPITGMVNQLAALDTSIVSAKRVFELMDETGEK